MFTSHSIGRWREAFFYALMFLTRLPVGRYVHGADAQIAARAVYCYPMVGLVMGILLALAGSVFAGLGPLLAAALTLTLWVMLTGALHLDGLADCMDAYYAGHKLADETERRNRILEVMHDPACGAVALVSLVLVLLVKVAALASLWQTGHWLLALVVAPVLGRTAILPFMALGDYARGGGSVPANASASVQALWLVALICSALVAVSLGVVAAAVVFAALALLIWFWWRLWLGQIGGYTGDCLGALVELSEVLVLVLLVALCS
ncbi:adenosylcobinamide-GDP ribazoletransferase [Gilvimarinus algae]|uniref:Adenosylcobinamide-GDP ribazoletransferase n=1 Tax=Gilvimarinus algae TaxID=3058037 RepID=A0ABT8TDW0_9GAMM|nr:adenosylcobinamide-GDP ribazoletransferase [Gilvimarinus sp. SDUM040014]MDO3381805.1 adenosylcobinamide-GDP ribazoletransferase [Gilvimarinus sp. SDUM040014]